MAGGIDSEDKISDQDLPRNRRSPRVGLDQVGIELMLADQLAETVADLGSAVISVLSIDRPGGFLASRGEGTGSANDPISSTE